MLSGGLKEAAHLEQIALRSSRLLGGCLIAIRLSLRWSLRLVHDCRL